VDAIAFRARVLDEMVDTKMVRKLTSTKMPKIDRLEGIQKARGHWNTPKIWLSRAALEWRLHKAILFNITRLPAEIGLRRVSGCGAQA